MLLPLGVVLGVLLLLLFVLLLTLLAVLLLTLLLLVVVVVEVVVVVVLLVAVVVVAGVGKLLLEWVAAASVSEITGLRSNLLNNSSNELKAKSRECEC